MKEEMDKAAWGPGEWQDEPDRMQWIDPVTLLPCLMWRHPSLGSWCAYVGLPSGQRARSLVFESTHRLDKWANTDSPLLRWKRERPHGPGYDRVNVYCHGGLTYSGLMDWQGPEFTKLRCVGMDFAHYMDFVPGLCASKIEALRTFVDRTFTETPLL